MAAALSIPATDGGRPDLLAGALPGVRIVALAPGYVLYDCTDEIGSDGDNFALEVIGSANPDDDGLLHEFATMGEALTLYPSLVPTMSAAQAVELLDAWEADDLTARRPCPDLLGWIRTCRRAVRMGSPMAFRQVGTFAETLIINS